MAVTQDYGFGEFTYARGWFMIADAGEASSVPMPVRFFGEDMVLYRGESGRAYLVEAYCPHMGAHIGKNTTSHVVRDKEHVQGESIRCPFHGWRFGPDGKCNEIPYSDIIPKAARLKTYPIVEKAGIIWMWHDPEGLEPEYPLPDFGGHYDAPGWVNWKIDHLGDVDIHPCEIVDNIVDLGHMVPIHGVERCVYFANEFDRHVVHQYLVADYRVGTGQPSLRTDQDTWYTGPGFLQLELPLENPVFMMIANTPIEEGRTRVWHASMVKMGDGSRPLTGEERAEAFGLQEFYRVQLNEDFEIWANKRPCVNPLAVPADGPYGKLRIWYKQFHNPRARAREFQKRVEGLTVSLDNRDRDAA